MNTPVVTPVKAKKEVKELEKKVQQQKATTLPTEPTEQQLAADSREALAYLKSRVLYLATPAYGGWLSVNYINSLLALINLCQNTGIKYTTSFKYNESLIPRARNAMVHDFLQNPNYKDHTDFVFIDADIGFDPRDIVTMMLRPDKKVIGAPCVRKSFNWARIAAALRSDVNRTFTSDELVKLGGEFVINFAPDAPPANIKLGDLTEVQDIGTGIMRVKRDVFNTIQEKFPDRFFLPMGGEGEKVPTYMFFQSGIDQPSGKFNPGGIPDYIPEDYAFCRLAREAGVKIWIAPWMKTTHMGSFMFQGDMEVVAKAGGHLR